MELASILHAVLLFLHAAGVNVYIFILTHWHLCQFFCSEELDVGKLRRVSVEAIWRFPHVLQDKERSLYVYATM